MPLMQCPNLVALGIEEFSASAFFAEVDFWYEAEIVALIRVRCPCEC